jgi:N-methylhydantoinase B
VTLVTNTGGMGISTYGGEGLAGGYPAPAAHYLLLKSSDVAGWFARREIPSDLAALECASRQFLRSKSNGAPLEAGDVFETTACGGGGFGDPIAREPRRVALDVASGHVSAAAAVDVYGVVLNADGDPEEAGTQQRREAMLRERAAWPLVTSAATEPDGVAADDAAHRPINSVLVALERPGGAVLACRTCGAVLSHYHGNYKEHVQLDRSPVSIIPLVGDPHRFHDEPMEFRRYCCPSCHTLLTTEVLSASEPVLPEMRLA